MSWQAAARGGILRMHRGVIPRSTGVGSLNNQLRRLCLSVNSSQTRPQLQSLAIGAITQSSSFATASKEPKEAKKPKAKATKTTTKKSTSSRSSPKKKKALTEKQEEAKKHKEHLAHVRQLKITALTPPKRLSTSFQPLALQEKLLDIKGQHAQAKDAFKAASELVKDMGTHDRERIQVQIEENRKANAAAYESFIKSHTPLEIREANVARRALTRLVKGRHAPLVDDRLVKKPMNSYVIFANSRWKTGEFEGLGGVGPFKTFSQEWSQLPSTQKQEFEKLAEEDRIRYAREHEEVYGFPPPQVAGSQSKP